jgi:hypothetical protein
VPFAAFRGGLLSRPELLSRFMHAEGLSWVVPGATSGRPSATARPARMPSDALGGFVDALEQPIRFSTASTATKDHSLSLFIVSLSPSDYLRPKCVSVITYTAFLINLESETIQVG